MVRFILLLLLAIFVARAIWQLFNGLIEGATGQPRASSRKTPLEGVQMVRDPVCGTFVVPDRAVVMKDGSSHLFFCSKHCRDAYRSRTA
jgi:hypothetical protein